MGLIGAPNGAILLFMRVIFACMLALALPVSACGSSAGGDDSASGLTAAQMSAGIDGTYVGPLRTSGTELAMAIAYQPPSKTTQCGTHTVSHRPLCIDLYSSTVLASLTAPGTALDGQKAHGTFSAYGGGGSAPLTGELRTKLDDGTTLNGYSSEGAFEVTLSGADGSVIDSGKLARQ